MPLFYIGVEEGFAYTQAATLEDAMFHFMWSGLNLMTAAPRAATRPLIDYIIMDQTIDAASYMVGSDGSVLNATNLYNQFMATLQNTLDN